MSKRTCVRCCGEGVMVFKVKRYVGEFENYEFWSCHACSKQGLGPMKNSFGVGMLPILPLPLKLFWKEFRWT